MPHEIRGVDVEKYALLCQETSPKRWFGNMEMTFYENLLILGLFF